MSSIQEALKRAQQERERLRAASEAGRNQGQDAAPPGPVAAALQQQAAESRAASSGQAAEASAKNAEKGLDESGRRGEGAGPVSQALQQRAVPAAKQAAKRAAETIVEDYGTKRKLQLPAALAVYHDRAGAAAEQYRKIRNTLLSDGKPGPRLWAITSSVAGEGKTTTVANLGLSLVELRAQRVLLIDADLQEAGLSRLFHLGRAPGLEQMLRTEAPPESFLQATPWHNLFVLPAGGVLPAAAATELLRAPHGRTALRHLRNMFDVTIADTPAAMRCPDAGLVGASADAVLVTVHLERTRPAAVQQTLRMLESLNLPVRGTILTHARGREG